jgi:hypothetical protein
MLCRVILLAFFLTAPRLALAGTIAPGGTWYEFSFTGAGAPALGCYPADPSPNALNCVPSSAGNSVFLDTPPWGFSTSAPVSLTVTDAFLYGDAFQVFQNCNATLDCVENPANLILTTPAPVSSAVGGCGDNPAVCVLDPLASHGTTVLDPGSYSLAIVPYAADFAGAAYFQVAPVPEPGTTLLIVTSFVGLIAAAPKLRRARR